MNRPTTGCCLRRWGGGFLVSVLLLAPVVQAAGARHTRVLIKGQTGVIVQHAITGAVQRLERPACAGLLTEFHASDGLPLAAHLSEHSVTPPEYLRTLWFADGDDQSRCDQIHGPVAFTAPGHPVVFVCGRHFVSTYKRNPLYAEILVIHEMLHAAGLGENPPSSEQISRTAMARCSSV
jgi:hypothetical protein